ncbi:response regulator [Trichocoleus sp. DQ-A3]|uniref:hybrid sensor histidine kinase/response regulator n=1 Tax=Cyanophyceae TaxID=3028117 RepID=UPI0018EF9E00|nr:hybrid sensor histidine kinase/response regulator [Coleofasciculus sp. FACHB-125]
MQPEQQQRIMGYFIEEAKDHLNTIEQGLVNLQSTIEDSEMVNEVFRAAHSVKGGAAMLGINSIQRTSHRLEDCFKVLKECPVKIDQKLESLFLKVSDTLKELIEQLSGPFGLTEEIANGIMSGVEPVFEELNQHMAFLVNGAGGNVSLEAASGAQEAGVATAAGGYLRDGQAQKRFQSDVLNQLREMLQLFKQTDQPRCRQQLQEICGSLERMGEQYECPKWSELIQASASAIANPENSYRTLATVVIKEIKQAQELVLAGRASSIEPSSQLNALLPSSATPSLLEQLDAEPSLIYSAQELAGATTADLQTRIASVQSQHSMTPAEAGTRQSRPKATDRFNYSETFIQEERFAAGESGAGLKEPSLTSANSDTTFSQPSIKSGRGKESANHPADPNGPEVGMAELNSLADLFEGEAPDLDETWQEEQVIGDGAENMGTERQEWLNLEQENDFSDLLGGDTDGLGKSATPATEEDDLTLFGFGEDLVEEGETPSAESEREDVAQLFAGSVSDGDEDDFSDLLFAADAPSAASEATPSENLANLWSDSFLEDEGFEQQENANPLSESLAAATDEDLLGILTSENLDLALLATESEALKSDSDEDLFGAAGIDTNENDSIEAAANQESSDWELMTTGTLFGEAAENSNQEVSEELETPSIMSTEGSDWATDWSSEDLQVLDSVAAAEPIAATDNDLPDFVFEDEQSTSIALTGDLEMGSLLEDEVDLTAAGWEEEPDFSNLDLFETPHARADNGDVLDELMLDDNTDLWLEETMPRNETNDLLDLSAAIGTPFESEAIAPEIEADAVGDVNLDFNWPAIPGVEDIDASTSSVDRAFLEDWSATDLAWDETIQPAGFSEVTAAQMPGTAREDLEDWENQLEFNETLVEEPFSALDDLDIPSNWASPDAFALDTSASDARNEEALDLLELDNPQTSPFSLDWESEAESTGSEIENLALQEDADANGALNAVPNLTETVSVDELGDFFGSQAAELETTEFASLDESLDMNGESHEVPQLDALDNFFEAEPEATATTEWDSSLDFASMSLSDGNTDAFDASLGEPLSSLFDPSQEEPLVSADASDDFFATTDAFLELPSEETSQESLDAAENLETMLGDEPSSSTDALDALDLNEENLLATEFDAEWGIDSAAVPVDAAFELDEDLLDSSLPAEAPENLEAMFGEAPAPTPEALELADSDLFGSDMDDAEWGIDLAAVPVESENLEAMFGEEASSAPTPEALELADSDLFSSETEAEWGIDLAVMPVESENLEAMFGEEASPALTPEALELSDSDLFGSETEAEWGIDLAAVPTEAPENLEAMFGEEASSASTPEALELSDSDLFGSETEAEWGIDLAAMPVESDNLEAMFGEEASSAPTPEALELADSDLFGSETSETEAERGIDLAAVPVESENLEAMFGEAPAPTPEALELADSDLFSSETSETEAEWGIDLAAVPVESENLEAMFGEAPAPTPEALELADSDLFSSETSETEAEWGIDLAAVPVESENLEAMFGEAPAPTPEALELADSDLFSSDMDDAEWGIDLAAVPAEAPENLEAMFGEEASSAPTPDALELADSDLFSSETEAEWGIDLAAVPVESENLEAMFGEEASPALTPEALELADSDLFGSETEAEWGIDLAAVPVESENLEAMFGEEASPALTPEALELADLDLFSSDMDDAEWGIDSAAVSQEAASELEDLLGSEPVEFGDGLDFEENLLIGEIPSENQASDADELKEVGDLWDLVTEQQEIANPSEAAVLDELSLLETVGEQDQDLAISLVENDEFDELEAMLGEEVFAEPASNLASNDEFDELEALLGEEESVPAAFDAEDMNEFADLEALLGDDEPQLVPQFAQSQRSPTKPIAETTTSADALDDGFGDLEELLGQAEETMGGPRSVKTSPGQVRPVNRPRPVKVFEQTMRVPVKHLDNLSNLVGELVVNRNTLEQDQERLRQFLDNLLHQVQQLSDVGARMQDRYERSLLESSLLASRQSNRFNARPDHTSAAQEAPANSRFGLGELELDLFTPFHSLSQEIIELIVRVRESAADIEFLVDETDQVARMLRQVTTQLQEGLTRSRMVPFAQTADRLPRAVREISLKCGKQAELQIEGRETLIDKVILEHLYDPMTHLVNNAITHGIEPPEVRIAAGKPPVGRITIRAFHQGNQTVISVSDDGAGIDSERVKAKAVEKGLITASEAKSMTRLEVYDLLFHPGFSTKDKADDFSGRGVGMDVVCTSLNEIRGVITTDSTLGKGTTFTVRLPLTLSICKALCCLSDKARIAFPMDGVEDMLDVPQDRIQTNSEGETCISWRDSLMPFQPLEELLTYQRHLSRGTVYGGNREDDMISVVVLRSAGNFIAVQVDQVLGEQEIVIKQLEGPVPKPLGVAGATVLGDGRIMPIADVLELIDLATGRIGKDRNVSLWDKAGVSLPVEAPAVKTDPMVLIVDDSITVRELLSMTFNKAGYRVEQARDGQEAWDKLRSGLPCEIVFCDIEMPRMDGLELLSRIQKDPSLNHLPVAMLTSRGASKHQQMAAQLGAKGYFTKPYLEEALLDAAQRMIKGEVLLSINTNA